MTKLIMVGRCFKGTKTIVVDLQAYREMKQGRKGKKSKRELSKKTTKQKGPDARHVNIEE